MQAQALAAMCSHVPNKGEQMARYYGFYSNVARGKRKKKKILQHLGLWDVKRKPRPVANAPPIDVFPAYDEQPGPSAGDLIRVPDYLSVALTTWQRIANGPLS